MLESIRLLHLIKKSIFFIKSPNTKFGVSKKDKSKILYLA